MFYFLVFLAILLLAVWFIVFVFVNDLSVKKLELGRSDKNCFVIFPHPDDEVLTVGGSISIFKHNNLQIKYLLLTRGEKGENASRYKLKLSRLRECEVKRSSKIIGFDKLKIYNFADGSLYKKKNEIKKVLEEEFEKKAPDIVITYDKSGLYGHPDHISLSEVVSKLRGKYGFRLLYSSLPKRIYQKIKLPSHMAVDKKYQNERKYPNRKIFVGINVIKKIRAMYAHKSQLHSFRKSFPATLPPWFVVSASLFEHFYEVK